MAPVIVPKSLTYLLMVVNGEVTLSILEGRLDKVIFNFHGYGVVDWIFSVELGNYL